jgi:excisionase family DNA binding protein
MIQVLTVKEVSSLLRVHPVTLYKLIRAGKIPSFRVGSDWRFQQDLIERWMAERSNGVGNEKGVEPRAA